ncbi:SDR family NAD(P)-dependent oxidoreductase [Bacillus glycinifermentans]|uniref:SDR family NAD(P)-dependent oxidoreductase n=1 Tax=Bacillus glycinifermentans TaxID=1664069 RepID=A0ABU6GZU6_9BACI|nr:SDR family NAD(P)-dependent oxidoreductase [Bacillus glycinifermentans]ATH94382.1 short-chain dehydrogenase [Bacillus glycinifermentans]MEC0484287.1 SDR family NAD(P)-dependent oxidoreductase [Bacillus glycinifermentans]MEC3607351.1 SDR family NAD(P)-dependent oxidoreductase [Bacillus glycinifermentans]
MINAEGKVVILTGASKGIGEAAAKVLANSGARVVLAARREERLRNLKLALEKQGGTAEYKVTDVTLREEMEELARFAIDNFGQIDVLSLSPQSLPARFPSIVRHV